LSKAGRQSRSGFTLVEMLVVLVIVALTATIAVPLLGASQDGLRLRQASGEMAAALRATRSAAVVRNAATTLLIDVDRRTFESDVVSRRSFASSIEAKLTFASGIGLTRFDGGFRFFPDGSSTGGDIMLSLRGNQAKVCVDWLTGQVRQEQDC
jgi:general secretion pathway protein H